MFLKPKKLQALEMPVSLSVLMSEHSDLQSAYSNVCLLYNLGQDCKPVAVSVVILLTIILYNSHQIKSMKQRLVHLEVHMQLHIIYRAELSGPLVVGALFYFS